MQTTILDKVATQVPDLVALLVIVFVFIKYLEKRDKLYLDLVNEIGRELKKIGDAINGHNIETRDAIAEMRRTVNKRAKR